MQGLYQQNGLFSLFFLSTMVHILSWPHQLVLHMVLGGHHRQNGFPRIQEGPSLFHTYLKK